MTIRAATDALVAEGLVERRHGSGTYVVPRPFARVLGLTSFTQDMAARGIVAGSRVLEFEHVPADAAVAGRLRIAVGTPRSGSRACASATVTPWRSRRRGSPRARAGARRPTTSTAPCTTSSPSLPDRPRRSRITIEPVIPDPETRRLLTILAGRPACASRWSTPTSGAG